MYLAASNATIGMVLVQEYDYNNEHVIYYLIRSLTKTKIEYTQVGKLGLEAVQVC